MNKIIYEDYEGVHEGHSCSICYFNTQGACDNKNYISGNVTIYKDNKTGDLRCCSDFDLHPDYY